MCFRKMIKKKQEEWLIRKKIKYASLNNDVK